MSNLSVHPLSQSVESIFFHIRCNCNEAWCDTCPPTHCHAWLLCPRWTLVSLYGITVAGAAGQLRRGGAGAAWAGVWARGSVVPGGCPSGHSAGGGGAAGRGPKRSWTGLFGMSSENPNTFQYYLICACLQWNCWVNKYKLVLLSVFLKILI